MNDCITVTDYYIPIPDSKKVLRIRTHKNVVLEIDWDAPVVFYDPGSKCAWASQDTVYTLEEARALLRLPPPASKPEGIVESLDEIDRIIEEGENG